MILCCGEALIDMIPEPTASGGEGFVPKSGGAIFNTALGLGRLGCPVGLLSGISSDLFGQQLMTDLTNSHVNTDRVILSDRPTTLAFVRLADGQASYSFFDENSAGRMIAPHDLPGISDDVTALYFGGISLAVEPGADTYLRLAETHSETRAVVLDPNIRQGFIRDETAYRTRLDRMIALADMVKVSDEDLDWIITGPATLEEKSKQLQSLGPSIVILTRGAEGAMARMADGQTISVPVPKVEVVDTVGAGDTFNAGVMASLWGAGLLSKAALRTVSDKALGDALRFGAQVAAINVGRVGANPPWRDEI